MEQTESVLTPGELEPEDSAKDCRGTGEEDTDQRCYLAESAIRRLWVAASSM
jgi:hypothetical protein